MRRLQLILAAVLLGNPGLLHAAAESAPTTWRASTLIEAVALMTLFAALGIVMAILGYKIFDKCTPGDLHREIIENRNVAAAILGGAIILGVCVIIAAAMLG